MFLRDYLVRNEIYKLTGGIDELITKLIRMGYDLHLESSHSDVLSVLNNTVGYKYGISVAETNTTTIEASTEVSGTDGVTII